MAAKAAGTGSLASEYSFISADCPNVIITVVKEACDSEDIIVRAYEANGKRTKAEFTLGFDVEYISEVNMLETEEMEKMELYGNTFKVVFKPYEIKTFRVIRK